MTQTLTPGKWRGLVSTSDADHTFTIMAFDQRGTYERMLPENTSYESAVHMKREVVTKLGPSTSAVLLDATYGLAAALDMPRGTGLLMALEKSGYAGTSSLCRDIVGLHRRESGPPLFADRRPVFCRLFLAN